MIYLTKLRKLDLSFNYIVFLPDTETWQALSQLEFVLLHNNAIVGWRQLTYFF
jgi:hypothetical protein